MCLDSLLGGQRHWLQSKRRLVAAWDPEARHQFEIVNEPAVDLFTAGVRAVEDDFLDKMVTVNRCLQERNLRVARIGCLPFLAAEDVVHTQGEPRYVKYDRCPQWHAANQRQSADQSVKALTTQMVNPYVVGLMNAVHISVDALSFQDAVDKLNRALMISPLAIALGANARYLNLCDTGFADVRFPAWEVSHDTRSAVEMAAGRQPRVGLPRRYYEGVADYFQRILSYPFILNDSLSLQKPFEVGSGTYWRDARLKFFRDKQTVAVEFRPIALQPSLREDVAMSLFFLGRLFWSQVTNEPLLPIVYVRQNKAQAVHHGLASNLRWWHKGDVKYDAARDVIAHELDRAETGLEYLGAKRSDIDHYFGLLRARLPLGSPAEQFAARVQAHDCSLQPGEELPRNRREAIVAAMHDLQLVAPVNSG